MSAPPPAEFRRVGRYQILSVLGRGAMGKVYKARDTTIDRLVALKVLETEGLARDRVDNPVQRFLREAQAAGRLLHPNIVAIFDVGEVPDRNLAYIAMEFVEGEPLDEILKRHDALSIDEILRIARDLARALGYAHSKGVVHRDIKPANILRTPDGVIKLADFGIAKLDASSLTQDGTFMGSPHYVSPEQARTKPVDGRSDLFSLGIVLYELLTLEHAFPGQGVGDVIYRILHEEPVPLRELRPDVPPSFAGCVARLLRKKPEERFQTADDLRLELDRVDLAEPVFTLTSRGAPLEVPGKEEPDSPPEWSVKPSDGPQPPSVALPSLPAPREQATAGAGSPPASLTMVIPAGSSAARRRAGALVAAAIVLVGAIGLWRAFGGRREEPGPPVAASATPDDSPVAGVGSGPTGTATPAGAITTTGPAGATGARTPGHGRATPRPSATRPAAVAAPTAVSGSTGVSAPTGIRGRHLAGDGSAVHCEGFLTAPAGGALAFRGAESLQWTADRVEQILVEPRGGEVRILYREAGNGKKHTFRFAPEVDQRALARAELTRWLGRPPGRLPSRPDEGGP